MATQAAVQPCMAALPVSVLPALLQTGVPATFQWLWLLPFGVAAACQQSVLAVLQVRTAGLTVPAVMLARGLVGLAEGVALPSMSNLVATAIPKARRSSALGGSFSGFHSGQCISCTSCICSWCRCI